MHVSLDSSGSKVSTKRWSIRDKKQFIHEDKKRWISLRYPSNPYFCSICRTASFTDGSLARISYLIVAIVRTAIVFVSTHHLEFALYFLVIKMMTKVQNSQLSMLIFVNQLNWDGPFGLLAAVKSKYSQISLCVRVPSRNAQMRVATGERNSPENKQFSLPLCRQSSGTRILTFSISPGKALLDIHEE